MPVLIDWEYNSSSQLISVIVDDDGDGIVELEVVRHGQWIEPDYVYFGAKRFVCSLCKDDDYWTKRYHNYKENRCPNCGAIMDEGEKE